MKISSNLYMLLMISAAGIGAGCRQMPDTPGRIERLQPALDSLISASAKIEVMARGFDWIEGPLWCEKEQMLLFSEIPKNEIYRWTADKGAEVYLKPAGFTGTGSRKGELGSNGLLLLPDGRLALCQHGDRRVAVMDAPLDSPQPKFITLAGRYQGKRLNSPNDLALSSTGAIYFTDPPYGLEKQASDPLKELAFQGVYRIVGDSCRLLVDSISRPNGIALMPGEKQLLVANSDAGNPVWYIYDISNDGSLSNGRIFARPPIGRSDWKGLPDGLKIDREGNVFATGPGGVYIFDKTGVQLGMIHFPAACSNVALADGGRTLWITADSYLVRVKMKEN